MAMVILPLTPRHRKEGTQHSTWRHVRAQTHMPEARIRKEGAKDG